MKRYTSIQALRDTVKIWKKRTKPDKGEDIGCPLCEYRDQRDGLCSSCPMMPAFIREGIKSCFGFQPFCAFWNEIEMKSNARKVADFVQAELDRQLAYRHSKRDSQGRFTK